jgi:hypothetical protein
MTICGDCGRNFEGIDRLCPDCAEEFQFITSSKVTGWTNEDDKILQEALDSLDLTGAEKWTADTRLPDVSRLTVAWMVEDIRRARARIKEIVAKSLDQFQEDEK